MLAISGMPDQKLTTKGRLGASISGRGLREERPGCSEEPRQAILNGSWRRRRAVHEEANTATDALEALVERMDDQVRCGA